MAEWARVVADLLAPEGRLYVCHGHPMLKTLDETRSDQPLVVTYPYFGGADPLRWEQDTSEVGEAGAVTSPVHYSSAAGLAHQSRIRSEPRDHSDGSETVVLGIHR